MIMTTQATEIKNQAADASQACDMAEKQAIAKDQDWQEGTTTYVFDDNSTLVVDGPIFTAHDNEE